MEQMDLSRHGSNTPAMAVSQSTKVTSTENLFLLLTEFFLRNPFSNVWLTLQEGSSSCIHNVQMKSFFFFLEVQVLFEVREETLTVGLKIALFTFSNKAQILNKDTYSDSKKPKNESSSITIKPTNFKIIFFKTFLVCLGNISATWQCGCMYMYIET